MRWIWRRLARDERGAQHVEAGVLIGTLVLLGGLVMSSTTTLGQAVAQVWTCRLGSDADCAPPPQDPPRQEARQLLGGVDDVTTSAAGADPAVSHGPPQTVPATSGRYGYVDSVGDVPMSACDTTHCTGVDGTLYECRWGSFYDPGSGLLQSRLRCSATITPATSLTCTDEGLSPTTDTCRGPNGSYYHCSNPDSLGNRACRDADNDADAHMPSAPTSCDTTVDGSGTVTCLGVNGTVYECTAGAAGVPPSCTDGTRALDQSDLADCVADLSRSSGSATPAGENPPVVRCTYTPTECYTEVADGGSCAEQAVTVRCLADDSDPTVGIALQHCQSLGARIPDGMSVDTICLVDAGTGCDLSASFLTDPVLADQEPASTTALDDLDVSVADDFDQELSIPTGATDANGNAVREDMSFDEMVEFCVRDPAQCQRVADATTENATAGYRQLLEHVGLCSGAADCQAVFDRLADAEDRPCRGRCPQARVPTMLRITGHGIFLGVNAYSVVRELTKGKYEDAAKAALFTVGVIAFATADFMSTRRDAQTATETTGAMDRLRATQRALQTFLSFAAADATTALMQNANLRGILTSLRERLLGQAPEVFGDIEAPAPLE